jgi:uncharacterized membrane protein
VHRLLWLLQVVLGVYFVAFGIMHFVVPDGLPEAMSWMYDLPDTLHMVSGTAEILGGLGLILPGLTGVRPELTWMAAFGLAIVMLGAAVWHIGRGEYVQIVLNLVTLGVLVFVGYGRLRLHPLRSA